MTIAEDSPTRWRNRIVYVDCEGQELPRDVSVVGLRANPFNWRGHPEGQRRILRTLLGEVGWVDSVKINLRCEKDGWPDRETGEPAIPTLIDGHARVEEAEQRGEPTVPVTWLRLSPDEERKILLGFDMVTEMAEEDTAATKRLAELVKSDDQYFRQLLEQIREGQAAPTSGGAGDAPEAEIDRADELREKWGTEPGQVWEIPSRSVQGAHRLLVGDSTDRADVARLLAGSRVKLLATDPPYNLDQDYRGTTDDDQDPVAYASFTRRWWEAWWPHVDKAIVTPGANNLKLWLDAFPVFHTAPWIKTNGTSHGVVSMFWCWEPILFLAEDGGTRLFGRKRHSDVFDFPIGEQHAEGLGSLSDLHPCPKKLEMWVDFYENYSEPLDLVADAFGGSGTGLVAAEKTGRLCYAAELNPAFTAVILERLAGMGLTPRLTREPARSKK